MKEICMEKTFKEIAIHSEWLTIGLFICRSCTPRSKRKFIIIILLKGEAEAPILVTPVKVAID